MATLYVVEQGACLYRKNGKLVVKKLGEEIASIHEFRVDQVIIAGNVTIMPSALNFLLNQNVDTVFLSLSGLYKGRLTSRPGKNVDLRRRQYSVFENTEQALQLAASYVRGKLLNCRTLLRRHNYHLQSEEIGSILVRLRGIIERLRTCSDLETLRGLEGMASRLYFQGFGKCLKSESLKFTVRTRRPPLDEVNAMLSFGYTLLANLVESMVARTGLDPYLGCLHSPEYGRPSLVLDLMEEFRPIMVDSLVLRVVNRSMFTSDDFRRGSEEEEPAWAAPEDVDVDPSPEGSRDEGPVLFKREALKRFIYSFETRTRERHAYQLGGQTRSLELREIVLQQVHLLSRHISGDDRYEPFLVR